MSIELTRGRRRPVLGMGIGLLALVALCAEPPARATPPASTAKCDAESARLLATQHTSGWASVIVRFDGAVSEAHISRLRSLGADIYRRLPIVNSVAARIPLRSLAAVAELPFVQRLSSDGSVHKCDQFTVGSSGANMAWSRYGVSGAGVTVAVVDSGIAHHPDVASRIVASVNLSSGLLGGLLGPDGCGHGTHVAGIVAGNGSMSTGSQYTQTFYGIAPAANLVSVRVLNGAGSSTVSTVIAGVQWVVTHAAQYKIRILNLSLGHPIGEPYTTDPLCQAVETAWKAGIVVVCAAGNDGREYTSAQPGANNGGYGTAYGTVESPGNDPYVITVGAMKSVDGTRIHDTIATYSSRGPSLDDFVLKPDLVAPGNKVISLDTLGALDVSYLDTTSALTNEVPDNQYIRGGLPLLSTEYFVLSGTSMATPVVSGAAALMLQANPSLTPDTIKARLMLSADKWANPDGSSDPCTYGAGYLDIPAAMSCTSVANGYAMSPTLSQDASGNVNINTGSGLLDNLSIWGTGVTDTRAIWGTGGIYGSNSISSSRAIWGTDTVWNDRAIWGTDEMGADLSLLVILGDLL